MILDHRAHLDDARRLLVGGAPLRVLRLSQRGVELINRWAGTPSTDPTPSNLTTAEVGLIDQLIDQGLAHPMPAPLDADTTALRTTVIIPVRDDEVGLVKTLHSIQRTVPNVAAVVVVDDASSNPITMQLVQAALGSATSASIIRQDKAGGPAAARNAGLAVAETPVVALVDADVTVTEGWLETLAAHLERPGVALAAPRVRSATTSGIVARYDRTESPLDLGEHPAQVGPDRAVTYVPSACVVADTTVLRSAVAVGDRDANTLAVFDPSLRFGEDVDLIWRLVDREHAVRYEPRVVVLHRPRHSVWAMARQRFGYGSAAGPLGTRHGDRVAPAAAVTPAALARTARTMREAGLSSERTRSITMELAVAVASGWARSAAASWWPVTAVFVALSPSLRAIGLVSAAVTTTRSWRSHRADSTSADSTSADSTSADSTSADSTSADSAAGPTGTLNPATFAALRAVDRLAYGTGVLTGSARSRTLAAVLPRRPRRHKHDADADPAQTQVG